MDRLGSLSPTNSLPPSKPTVLPPPSSEEGIEKGRFVKRPYKPLSLFMRKRQLPFQGSQDFTFIFYCFYRVHG